MYAIAAEIFEESLIPFIPKILSTITKRLKEGSSDVHVAYAEAIGAIAHHVITNLQDEEEIDSVLDTIFTMIFTNLNQPSRITQAAAANCLTKVIQNTPLDPLLTKLPTVCQSILDTMASSWFKSTT